ncbi:HIG1 domain family member 2A, mitochondrial-like [Halichondria panicea]|uniref:HIG1 domain family member 2A, mitochondrial-like n=1 Tax=Halichondria panicea TaxID=6063 RepID=UPI00312BC2FF
MAALPPPPAPSAEDLKAIRAVRNEELGWLPPDPTKKKNIYFEKMMENPLVPIGCAATVGALLFGLLNFKRGNLAKSQLAMRMRVLAQTGTVVALAGGAMWQNAKKKDPSKSRT